MSAPKPSPSSKNDRRVHAAAGSIVSRLNQEWKQLSRRPHAIAQANQWDLPGGPVAHLDVVLERCGFDQSGNLDRHDEYLRDLTRLASHDELAARIILQRIMPGLVSIAVRRAPITPRGLAGAFDLVISAAWLVIRQFPIDRRPRRVAANILMDIEYLAFVRDSRLKATRNEQTSAAEGMLGVEAERLRVGDHALDPVADETAFELLIHSLSGAGMSERDIQMLRAVGLGINSTEAAEVLGISPRSVRNRRENALERALALLAKGEPDSCAEGAESPQRSGMSS